MLFTDIVDAGKEAITLNDEKVITDDKEQSKTFLDFNFLKWKLDYFMLKMLANLWWIKGPDLFKPY